MSFIYLDYAATTPLSKTVKNKLIDYINNDDSYFFNSGSSTYEKAKNISDQIELARADIAKTLGVLNREIIFTSGATESNNLAIKGIVQAYQDKGKHIITSKAEHKAVLDVCKYLETQGCKVTYLEVDSRGRVDTLDLEKAITEQTILVSLMAVNNELGTMNDLIKIGEITKRNMVFFHVDAAQGYGKVNLDIKAMNIDLLSVSGHKIYSPKGVGFLYVRSRVPRVKLVKQIHGGTQEFGIRAGTLPNYQIFALAEACKDIFTHKEENYRHIIKLRDMFLEQLSKIENIKINTDLQNSYPGILNVTIKGVKAETLLAMLDEVCLSMGSACNSKAIEPSHVLRAIGLNTEEADSTIRVSFGLPTTEKEVIKAVSFIKEKVRILRMLSPFSTF
ncbi:cysteine desulfurase [Allofrancisella guangzhouensis]|uniref:cysteine desulfurase n=1 Tax=Allofrancisella guangzhouensis TaxID=594679 RepID=A0A0A8E5V5_9GAMM|nr:cysteine desulfurase family protein [Allofrancisella guangzhouensis]AJC48982.1 cysteine desulfurase [Allofrancisella guangzhouensis]MBK2027887.1 cysteine desulfurase [Allofrancisella guangzhouensis]MBK2044140.1 cysteine desulfurase [Allofrancisella guangzhouensis]MBK2045120.1 cysteine desulfurase [Allofrancisella guangzhouensis]